MNDFIEDFFYVCTYGIGGLLCGLFIIFIIWVGSWIFRSTGQGERTGQIVKMSHTGVLFKTYEGEIIKGGLTNGSGGFGAPLDFTIKDENKDLISKAYAALNAGQEVTLVYHTEKHCVTTSDTDSCTFADNIIIND